MAQTQEATQTGKGVFKGFLGDGCLMMGAALAYYTVLSLGPIVLILLWIASMLGQQSQDSVAEYMRNMFGPQAEQAVQNLIANAKESPNATLSGILGLVGSLVGATLIFAQLQTAFNRIWHVKPERSAVIGWLWQRLVGLLLLIFIAAVLLASFAISTALSAAVGQQAQPQLIWHIVETVISFAVAVVVFAILLQYLPDAQTAWKWVWLGGVLTAVLFTVGRIGINIYMTRASPGSAYGAAGWVILLMVYAYFAALMLMLGAEFTACFADRRGDVQPGKHAVRISAEQAQPSP